MKLTAQTVASLILLACLSALALPAFGQQDIVGLYRFLEDQPADISPTEGAEITLDVDALGKMHLTAQMPGQALTTEGTYRLDGNLISLDFPEFGKSVQNKPWSLENGILILPMQFIGDGEGTSRWELVPAGDSPIVVFFDAVNRETEGGKPPPEAVEKAAEEAKRRSAETAETEAETIADYEVWDDGGGCSFEWEDGHQEDALVLSKTPERIEPRVLQMGLWTRDPRTHIPARPHLAPDDPHNKTAIIFAPFDNAPYWSVNVGGMGKPVSFKEAGEDVELIKDRLEACHYTVEVLRDTEATPRALHEAVLRLQPGVLYISSHGGAAPDSISIGTGAYLGSQINAKEIMNGSDRIRALLQQALPPGYPSYLDAGMTTGVGAIESNIVVPLWYQRNRGDLVAVLNINNRFFRKMVQDGADFGTSLVYVSACFSAANNSIVRALKPRMYIGYENVTTNLGSARLAHYFFHLMKKPTWSPREVMALQRLVVTRQQCIFFPEDGWLAVVPQEDIDSIRLYGADGKACPPEGEVLPEQPATGQYEIPDEDVVYLCWMARWNSKEPEKGCEALQHAYDEYWSKGSFSRLKSPFANAGVRGTHMPTAEEVEQAMHLVCGNPSLTCGRFTLNDADPIRVKPEPEQ